MIRSGWLGQVPDALADEILAAGTWRTFAEGEIVYGLGAEEQSLWGIDSGCIRMHVAFNEAEPRFCHVAGPGSWFGELAFVTGLPRPFEMETASPCRLLRVGRREVDRIAEAHPTIWREIARLAALNEATAIGGVDDLMLRSADRRLAAILLRLASRRNAFQGTPPINVIPASQNEIADACGLSRTVTATLLAEFAASGAIRTGYRKIRVLKPQILENVFHGRD